MPNRWECHHFSLALADGVDRSDVPALLRHLADTLDGYGPMDVQDITFHTDVTANGFVHNFTVYFQPKDEFEDS
jgi:hypothetical protein